MDQGSSFNHLFGPRGESARASRRTRRAVLLSRVVAGGAAAADDDAAAAATECDAEFDAMLVLMLMHVRARVGRRQRWPFRPHGLGSGRRCRGQSVGRSCGK